VRRITGLVVVLAAVLAGTALAHGSSSTASPSSASVPVLQNCGEWMVAPTEYTVACADANYLLQGMTWKNWGAATATGTGTAVINPCVPTCVVGKFKSYPVTASAGGRTKCGSGQVEYTMLILHYKKGGPVGLTPSDFHQFPCDQPQGGPSMATSAATGRKVIISGTAWPVSHSHTQNCSPTVTVDYLKNGQGTIGTVKVDSKGNFQLNWKAPHTGWVVITGKQTCTGFTTTKPSHPANGFFFAAAAVYVNP
jgi:hypothetical protein